MKKRKLSISIYFYSLIVFFFSINFTGCRFTNSDSNTEEKFRNNIVVNKDVYSLDSIKLLEQLKLFLRNHNGSFSSKEYFDSKELSIDTILYAPNFKRIAIFIVAKTPINRRLYKSSFDNKYSHWFDAYCYLGIRKNDGFELKWLRRFNSINWYDKTEILASIHEDYFVEFSKLKDASGAYQYKYNINDKRFWDCSVWDEYFETKK